MVCGANPSAAPPATWPTAKKESPTMNRHCRQAVVGFSETVFFIWLNFCNTIPKFVRQEAKMERATPYSHSSELPPIIISFFLSFFLSASVVCFLFFFSEKKSKIKKQKRKIQKEKKRKEKKRKWERTRTRTRTRRRMPGRRATAKAAARNLGHGQEKVQEEEEEEGGGRTSPSSKEWMRGSELKSKRSWEDFRENEDMRIDEITYSKTLTSDERRYIHALAGQLGLVSKSYGKGANRYLSRCAKRRGMLQIGSRRRRRSCSFRCTCAGNSRPSGSVSICAAGRAECHRQSRRRQRK